MTSVVYSFPGPLGAPGIGTTAWHQIDAMARAGASVTAVVTRQLRPFDPGTGVRVLVTLGPIRPRIVGFHRSHSIHDAVAAHVIAGVRPQVVHTWPRAVLRSTRAAHACGASVIRESPSPYTRVAVAQAARAWDQLGVIPPAGHFHDLDERWLLLEDREFAAVDAITVGSEFAASTFGGTPFADKVLVVPYGYDETAFTCAPSGSAGRTFVFVGRLEPAKGVHLLLDAWSRAHLPAGTRLLLYGALHPPMHHVLADRLDQPGVHWLGFTQDIPAVLRDADVLVLPSLSEGSALVTYEAFGAGCIPLVSDASGSPVRHDADGLVHPGGDVERLTEDLHRTASSAELYSRLLAGLLSSRERWGWRSAGPRLLRAHESAARRLGGVSG